MTILLFIFGMLIVVGGAMGSALLFFTLLKKQQGEITEDSKNKGLTFKEFWWDYYKQLAAVPTTWIILHIIVFFTFTDAFKAILEFKLSYFMALQLSVFVLNTIVNKDIRFEERLSRKLITWVYVVICILAGTTIIGWPWYGESYIIADKNLASRIITIGAAEISNDIQKLSNEQKTDPKIKRLKQLKERLEEIGKDVKKGDLAESEAKKQRIEILEEQKSLMVNIKKIVYFNVFLKEL